MAFRRLVIRRRLAALILPVLALGGAWLAFLALNAPLAPAVPDCTSIRKFCVGMVAAREASPGADLNQQTWEALRRSRIADWVQRLETNQSKDYAENIAFFAEQGYDVIVTVGSEAAEATVRAAEKYPACYFIGVDQEQRIERENLAGLVFPEDQAGFLAGVLAARVSETGRIGALCSTQAIPAYWRYCEGFRAGALYAAPELQVNVLYNNSYTLSRAVRATAWAETSTRMLISLGVDVIFVDPTETGQAALRTAVAGRVRVIASGAERYLQWPEAHPYLLTSVLPVVEPTLLTVIRAAAQAQAAQYSHAVREEMLLLLAERSPSVVFPGNWSGAVGYAPFYEQTFSVPIEVLVELEATRQALLTGQLETGVPPRKP